MANGLSSDLLYESMSNIFNYIAGILVLLGYRSNFESLVRFCMEVSVLYPVL